MQIIARNSIGALMVPKRTPQAFMAMISDSTESLSRTRRMEKIRPMGITNDDMGTMARMRTSTSLMERARPRRTHCTMSMTAYSTARVPAKTCTRWVRIYPLILICAVIITGRTEPCPHRRVVTVLSCLEISGAGEEAR
ncbi:MAG: hypothetical protein BWX71_00422 [Deltaproteobacteria bacterium ADurb.Bin072]|nr:MAG: hypothetical protein BWX71_00422 [Deltaproteobacteria bacterium ADurb.Bin072]